MLLLNGPPNRRGSKMASVAPVSTPAVLDIFPVTISFNQPNGNSEVSQTQKIGAPPGTIQAVVAVLSGFELNYGSPNTQTVDHNLAFEKVFLQAAYDSGFIYVTATALLRDDSGKNIWSGSVYGTVLAFGQPPTT
jgi:hypothetical protein